MDCPNCRRPIPPHSEFCLYCGTRLSPEPSSQQPVSSPLADAQAEETAAPPEHFCSSCGKALDIHGKCPRCSRPSARAKKKPLFSAMIVLLAGLNLILLCLQLPYIANAYYLQSTAAKLDSMLRNDQPWYDSLQDQETYYKSVAHIAQYRRDFFDGKIAIFVGDSNVYHQQCSCKNLSRSQIDDYLILSIEDAKLGGSLYTPCPDCRMD